MAGSFNPPGHAPRGGLPVPRLEWYVIAPSSRIAGLCHSVLRGEPYSTCQLACSYCYARWYRGPHGEPRPMPGLTRLIRELGRVAREHGVLFPVRIATLSDPFQPAEARYRVTLRALREASRQGVPVVLNTRVAPPGGEYWRVIRDLAGQGLLLAQVTLTSGPGGWGLARRLEPGSPPPWERLALAASLADAGAPVMVRLQPFIPGVLDRELDTVLDSVGASGAQGVILEFLRLEEEAAGGLERLLGWGEWEPYALPEAGLVHPPLGYRLEWARRASAGSLARGLAFQTCKEGLFHTHHPRGLDCCGFNLLRARVHRRPHLWDVYLGALASPRGIPVEDALREACRAGPRLLCGDALESLPSWLRRPLKLHERRLERILSRPQLLGRLTPDLRLVDGRIVVVHRPLAWG